mmetsp:Transcript_26694/g.69759  ORF Transcript_26694/g.69759 Transcript_26694/m.69759 type:complete len:238 (-) Transcript_26694:328-1041(-)
MAHRLLRRRSNHSPSAVLRRSGVDHQAFPGAESTGGGSVAAALSEQGGDGTLDGSLVVLGRPVHHLHAVCRHQDRGRVRQPELLRRCRRRPVPLRLRRRRVHDRRIRGEVSKSARVPGPERGHSLGHPACPAGLHHRRRPRRSREPALRPAGAERQDGESEGKLDRGAGRQEGPFRKAPILHPVPKGPRVLHREAGSRRSVADRLLRRCGQHQARGVFCHQPLPSQCVCHLRFKGRS